MDETSCRILDNGETSVDDVQEHDKPGFSIRAQIVGTLQRFSGLITLKAAGMPDFQIPVDSRNLKDTSIGLSAMSMLDIAALRGKLTLMKCPKNDGPPMS
jgi:hypothetical protein